MKVPNKPKASWVELFKENRQQSRGLSLPTFEIEGTRAVLEMQDADKVEKVWGFYLVGFIARKFLGEEVLIRLCESWNVKYQYLAHSSGWLVFKFPNCESRDEVLQKGPYSVFGHLLLLKIMAPDFDFDVKPPLTVPV